MKKYITLRDRPELKDMAAMWFHSKWGVPKQAYRRKGIAGHLLGMVVEDMRSKGISPLYLITDLIGFYERYGWEFLCMVYGDGEPEMTRVYIHR